MVRLLKLIYELTRLPIIVIYGGFPVKLVTVIGDPIDLRDSKSPEEAADKVIDCVHTTSSIPEVRNTGAVRTELLNRNRDRARNSISGRRTEICALR